MVDHVAQRNGVKIRFNSRVDWKIQLCHLLGDLGDRALGDGADRFSLVRLTADWAERLTFLTIEGMLIWEHNGPGVILAAGVRVVKDWLFFAPCSTFGRSICGTDDTPP